jgi:hypothetical protein
MVDIWKMAKKISKSTIMILCSRPRMDDIAIFCMDSETNHAKKVKGEYRRKDRENKTKTMEKRQKMMRK